MHCLLPVPNPWAWTHIRWGADHHVYSSRRLAWKSVVSDIVVIVMTNDVVMLLPPGPAQVRRLVAVLSVRGVSKGVLLEGLGLDDSSPRHAQRAQHAQQGWPAIPQQHVGEPAQPEGPQRETGGPSHAQQAEQQGAGALTGPLVLGGVALGAQEAALLEACGLSRAAGVPSLVNFSGGWAEKAGSIWH